MPGIPDTNAAICASSDELWRSIVWSLTSDSINLVAHLSMGLHSILLGSALDVVNDKLALVIDCSDVANAHWRCLECASLNSELFLPFAQ